MALPVKGQEIVLTIIANGVVQDELTDILDFNLTINLELLERKYLGETTNRYDDIFNGAHFDFEMHKHSAQYFTFVAAIIDRARRRTPDVQFNVTGTFAFPDGELVLLTLPDCKFGPQAIGVASRSDYSKVKIEGAVDSFDIAA